MIVRPSSTASEARAAGATGVGPIPIDPTVAPVTPPRFAERGAVPAAPVPRATEPDPETAATPLRLGEAGFEESTAAAAAAAPPRTADRPAASARSGTSRSPTRSAHRAAPVVEQTMYRAVFACCCEQVRGAPTDKSPS